jgi:hypothetical protein
MGAGRRCPRQRTVQRHRCARPMACANSHNRARSSRDEQVEPSARKNASRAAPVLADRASLSGRRCISVSRGLLVRNRRRRWERVTSTSRCSVRSAAIKRRRCERLHRFDVDESYVSRPHRPGVTDRRRLPRAVRPDSERNGAGELREICLSGVSGYSDRQSPGFPPARWTRQSGSWNLRGPQRFDDGRRPNSTICPSIVDRRRTQ